MEEYVIHNIRKSLLSWPLLKSVGGECCEFCEVYVPYSSDEVLSIEKKKTREKSRECHNHKKVREKSRECHNQRPQEEEKTDKSKQAQTEQTYEKH